MHPNVRGWLVPRFVMVEEITKHLNIKYGNFKGG